MHIGAVIKWFDKSVEVDFGTVHCSNYTWGNGNVSNIPMPEGFTTTNLKRLVITEAIGDSAQNRVSDLAYLGDTYVHSWINAKDTSGWYIKNVAYRIYNNGNNIGAGVSYFGIDLEGSYNTTNLKVWNVGDFHPKLWIVGAIYSN